MMKTQQCNEHQIDGNCRRDDKQRRGRAATRQSLAEAVVMLVLGALLCTSGSALGAPSDQQSVAAAATTNESQGGGDGGSESAATRSALEAELNALLQQHEDGADSKSLSEAIISRLMLANLSEPRRADEVDAESQSQSSQDELTNGAELTGPEAMRLRKLLAYLHNYELLSGAVSAPGGAINNGQVFDQFPVLPASQAATIKRASMKLGNFVRGGGVGGGAGGSQSPLSSAQRQLNGGAYGRTQSFDFGLGKRPDASVAGNFLRFGDSAGSHGHTVASGLGKRPSAHRYDFGLGKRVASPAYPRYDFGLGKRVPNRIRYDFGLGK